MNPPQARAQGEAALRRQEQRPGVRDQGPVRDPALSDHPHEEARRGQLWRSVER